MNDPSSVNAKRKIGSLCEGIETRARTRKVTRLKLLLSSKCADQQGDKEQRICRAAGMSKLVKRILGKGEKKDRVSTALLAALLL